MEGLWSSTFAGGESADAPSPMRISSPFLAWAPNSREIVNREPSVNEPDTMEPATTSASTRLKDDVSTFATAGRGGFTESPQTWTFGDQGDLRRGTFKRSVRPERLACR